MTRMRWLLLGSVLLAVAAIAAVTSSGWKPYPGSQVVWTLPASDGTSGQALITDGSKNTTWSTIAGTGVPTNRQLTVAGTSNEVTSSAGAQDLSADRIWTLSLSPTVNLSSHTLRVPNSATLPATCTVGDAYMDTDATTGQRWYLCESTNTWVVEGGGGGGTPGGSSTQVQYNNAGAFGGVSGATSDGTSLTVKDANLKIADDGDVTKIAQLQASGITTGTTRTYTLPDASTTVTGTDVTQTLTNKRVTPRVTAASDATSITPNGDTTDIVTQTNTQGAGTLTINAPTGTPTAGQGLELASRLRIPRPSVGMPSIVAGQIWPCQPRQPAGPAILTTTCLSTMASIVSGIWSR